MDAERGDERREPPRPIARADGDAVVSCRPSRSASGGVLVRGCDLLQLAGKAVPGARKRWRRRRHRHGVELTTFNGLRLLTAPGLVMTPRPASERLVAAAAAHVGARRARIADVGTGSGAIAIAIATACPRAEVWATDTIRCAVVLARENVRRHRLEGRVVVQHGDLIGPVPGLLDLVVAPTCRTSPRQARPLTPNSSASRSLRSSPPATGSSSTGASLTPPRCGSPRTASCSCNYTAESSRQAGPSCPRSAPRSTGPLSAERRVGLPSRRARDVRRDGARVRHWALLSTLT
jgi:hypothetical protein